jgi:hypothetical protein
MIDMCVDSTAFKVVVAKDHFLGGGVCTEQVISILTSKQNLRFFHETENAILLFLQNNIMGVFPSFYNVLKPLFNITGTNYAIQN